MFQAFNLIPTLTAQENVETALEPFGLPGPSAAKAPRRRGPRRPRRPPAGELSGGQQQRVAIRGRS